MNICIYVFVWTYIFFSLGYIPKSEILFVMMKAFKRTQKQADGMVTDPPPQLHATISQLQQLTVHGYPVPTLRYFRVNAMLIVSSVNCSVFISKRWESLKIIALPLAHQPEAVSSLMSSNIPVSTCLVAFSAPSRIVQITFWSKAPTLALAEGSRRIFAFWSLSHVYFSSLLICRRHWITCPGEFLISGCYWFHVALAFPVKC